MQTREVERDGGAEVVVTRLDEPDDAPAELLAAPRAGGGRVLAVGGGLLVAVLALAALNARGGTGDPVPAPARPTAAPTPRATPVPTPITSAGRTVLLDRAGRPLLGVTAGWQVFAVGPSGVVRLDPAHGTATLDRVRPARDAGPVSFVAGPTGVLVRPVAAGPGYAVDDDRGVVPLPAVLRAGGLALPARAPDRIWVAASAYEHPVVRLTDFAGRSSGPVRRLAPGSLPVSSDGAGGLLTTGIGGVYRLDGTGRHLLTRDLVTAVGPTRLLVTECGPRTCGSVVIDQRTGARRPIGGPVSDIVSPRGAVSPDGTTAALPISTADGTSVVSLVDLRTGRSRALGPHLDRAAFDGGLAWSPDSRWLFLVAAGHRLMAVDPRTARPVPLGMQLPPVTQVAVRP